MRIRPLLAYAAVMLALTLAGPALASAQSAEAGSRHNKVFGYQDPETGVFHPLSTATPDVSTPATTGTIELVMTITLKTALPKGGAVLCGVDLTAFSENLSTYTISDWYEEAYTAATVSGSTATCTVNVPYSWVLPAASVLVTRNFSATYQVQMTSAPATAPSGQLPTELVRYTSGTFLSTTSIPSSGTTTKVTQAVVI